MQRPFGLIVLSIALGILGQFLLKSGMIQPTNQALIDSVGSHLRTALSGQPGALLGAGLDFLRLLLNPWVLAGFVCYGLSSISWLMVLSRAELSFAYPLLSMGYVVIVLIGWLAFGENVTLYRWGGVLLIILGITALYSEAEMMRHARWLALLFAGLAAALFVNSKP